MRASDAPKLPGITDAFNNLRAQGATIGADVLKITLTLDGATVIYTWDPASSEWQITAE